jgi:hypothetical protein
MIIWDVAGAALKKATVSSIASAGSVSSIAGNTGAFTLSTGITNVGNDIRSSVATAAGQFVGTATNDNATAGNVGEIIESEILIGSAISLVNATAKDITSISLTAGDWNVWGTVATNPAGTTTTSLVAGWVSTVSAVAPTIPNKGAVTQFPFAAGASFGVYAPVGMRRLSLSTTTTVFLSTVVVFATSTMGAYGYIGARRVR